MFFELNNGSLNKVEKTLFYLQPYMEVLSDHNSHIVIPSVSLSLPPSLALALSLSLSLSQH